MYGGVEQGYQEGKYKGQGVNLIDYQYSQEIWKKK